MLCAVIQNTRGRTEVRTLPLPVQQMWGLTLQYIVLFIKEEKDCW